MYNLAPSDFHFERGQTILKQREKIKGMAIETWRLLHPASAAKSNEPDVQDPVLEQAAICFKIQTDGQPLTSFRKLFRI